MSGLVYRCRWLLSVSGLCVELSPFARPLPVGYSRNSWHKGRQPGDNTKEHSSCWTGVLPAAFRILSPKWVFPQNSWPIPWLMPPHLTAMPSCKELSIPERAVDKKTPHKETDNKKNVWPLSGVRFLTQQVSLKPQPTGYKQADLTWEKKNMWIGWTLLTRRIGRTWWNWR